ncbi:MAG: hypothetical protein P4M13_10920 [Alphaproteobacteria bacterium]|nr:hypothetical protein [Alphaproteobacteria bacterium]
MTQRKHPIRGFTLVEFAIVLGVIGAIMGGIWAMSGSMRNNTKQEKFSEMLTTTVGNIRGHYAGKAYFESHAVATMMPKLTSMNVFPGDAVYQNGGYSVVDNPFGSILGTYNSSFYVCGWMANPTAAQSKCDTTSPPGTLVATPLFAIESLFSDVASCGNAVVMNSNPATLPGLVAVYVNGNKDGGTTALPISPAVANLGGNCGSSGTKVVDFVFRLNP